MTSSRRVVFSSSSLLQLTRGLAAPARGNGGGGRSESEDGALRPRRGRQPAPLPRGRRAEAGLCRGARGNGGWGGPGRRRPLWGERVRRWGERGRLTHRCRSASGPPRAAAAPPTAPWWPGRAGCRRSPVWIPTIPRPRAGSPHRLREGSGWGAGRQRPQAGGAAAAPLALGYRRGAAPPALPACYYRYFIFVSGVQRGCPPPQAETQQRGLVEPHFQLPSWQPFLRGGGGGELNDKLQHLGASRLSSGNWEIFFVLWRAAGSIGYVDLNVY